ncbi:MAG: family 10 glycosylhydrolase [Nitrospinae bacterium]|nr:family 10 glycosylhydrolase [Nitrospinota bacterium]
MKRFLLTIALIGTIFFTPAAIYPHDNPINAVQILWMNCRNFDEVEESILKLKMAGVNTLIIRVFQNRFDRFYPFANPKNETGVYFNTSYAPVVDDILGKLAEIAHKNNIKIFAWMTTRDSSWLIENHPDFKESIYDFKTNYIIKGERLNIFNPKVMEILKGVYRDLARYDIDGILFQDDLVLRHTEGYSNEARSLFKKDTGIKADPAIMYKNIYQKKGRYYVSLYTPYFWKWSEWKSKRLSHTASEIMSAAREVNPDLKFAINLYYETVSSPRDALAWLSQNINELINHKFDYYAVMAYHRQMKRELGFSDKKIYEMLSMMTDTIIDKVGTSKILMKVQVMDWDTKASIPEGEIETAINSIKNGRDINLSFVPVTEDTPLNIIEKAFNNSLL